MLRTKTYHSIESEQRLKQWHASKNVTCNADAARHGGRERSVFLIPNVAILVKIKAYKISILFCVG